MIVVKKGMKREIVLLTLLSGIGGFLFGYDTGETLTAHIILGVLAVNFPPKKTAVLA